MIVEPVDEIEEAVCDAVVEAAVDVIEAVVDFTFDVVDGYIADAIDAPIKSTKIIFITPTGALKSQISVCLCQSDVLLSVLLSSIICSVEHIREC